ncbi:DUF881 domain-containing protein [Paraoerskovia sediminicola]|uniref:DUF881 domain-containing protein n=1 Tax=Paraoerskovia sediminicola TaxID=1138587 RepID=UPI0025731F1E|nr:DUF881 domain-containing protein [Paraoerskovia sediminicola]
MTADDASTTDGPVAVPAGPESGVDAVETDAEPGGPQTEPAAPDAQDEIESTDETVAAGETSDEDTTSTEVSPSTAPAGPETSAAPASPGEPAASPGRRASAEPAETAEPTEPTKLAETTPSGATSAPAEPASSADNPGGWTGLWRALRPHRSRAQILAGVLCAAVGFALVVQVGANQSDDLSNLRQSELVPLLDDVTTRSEALEEQVRDLETTRDELRSGAAGEQAALELAREQAVTEGILAGRLPAQGPGIDLTIIESGEPIPAATMFNILEELRNAGAEVVEVNGVRVGTSTSFTRDGAALMIDDTQIDSPYRWKAIGDPATLETALQIVGGAMAAVRNKGAQETIRQLDELEIDSVRELSDPEFATPVPEPGIS